MIIYVDSTVLALLSILTSIIAINVMALPTAKLQLEDLPGVPKLHRRINEGNKLLPRAPVTRSESNTRQQYSNLLKATFLSENSKKLLDNVKNTAYDTSDITAQQLVHHAIPLGLTRHMLNAQHDALLKTLPQTPPHADSEVHPGDRIWADPNTMTGLDVKNKVKKLCYTRESPPRRTTDALVEASNKLEELSGRIVRTGIVDYTKQFIEQLDGLCRIAYPGYPRHRSESIKPDSGVKQEPIKPEPGIKPEPDIHNIKQERYSPTPGPSTTHHLKKSESP